MRNLSIKLSRVLKSILCVFASLREIKNYRTIDYNILLFNNFLNILKAIAKHRGKLSFLCGKKKINRRVLQSRPQSRTEILDPMSGIKYGDLILGVYFVSLSLSG
jgi:hypothetical protein